MQWIKYGWDTRRTLAVATLFVAGGVILWRIWPSATTIERASSDTVKIALPKWEPEASEAEWRPRPSDHLFEGALMPFRDGGPVAHGGKFEYLVQYLARQDAQVFSASINAETHAAGKHLDFQTVMRDPERFRGQPVRIFGPLHFVDVAKLEITPGTFRNIWRGFVTDPSGDEAFVFESAEPLPEGLKHNDNELVTVEGLFLQVFSYESETIERNSKGVAERKPVWRQVPFVLARRVERVNPEAMTRVPPDLGSSGGTMVLFIPMLLIPLGAYVVIRLIMMRKAVTKAMSPLGRRPLSRNPRDTANPS